MTTAQDQHRPGCPALGGYGHGAEECICGATTAQDQQSREAYEDGKWYWVENEGWHGEPPTIAPACYKANCDAWYSHIFSGISTPYLKVLEPCERQAARALPAPVICYVRPGATLPRRMGWETCAATDAGALAVHADGRALDVGVEPVAWTVASGVTNWARDFSKYKTQHYVRPVFTASQVLAMLAQGLAPGWQAVPVEPTGDMLMAIMSAGEVDVLRETPEKHQVLLIDRAGIPERYVSLLAAAPRPPAAQANMAESHISPPPAGATTEPQAPTTGAGSATAGAAQEFKPFTDEELGYIVMGIDSELAGNAKALIRAVERHHGIT